MGGEWVKKSLNLTSWEAASELITAWTASGAIGVQRADVPGIVGAVEKFFEDARARGLADATLGKLTVLLKKRLLPWCERKGYRRLPQLTVDALTQFRATWSDSPISKYKKQERLNAFFKFCSRRHWITENPVEGLTRVKVVHVPTMPFTDEEVDRLLHACDRYPLQGIYRAGNRTRLRAMTLLLRYSGLRIRDGVCLQRAHLRHGKIFIYTQKTGTPVWVPVPEPVIDAFAALPFVNDRYFFWSGHGDPKSVVSDWQRSFRRLFELAGVKGHPHMFRDTFAVSLLEKGVPLEQVSILLGHSSVKITEKHYSPWVKSRQQQLEAAVRKAW